MAEINRAWQMLSDPDRRRTYDLGLGDVGLGDVERGDVERGDPHDSSPAAASEPAFNPLARYQDPPRIPWRLMTVLAFLGAAFVLIGVATEGNPQPPTVDNILRPGDCVAIQSNGDAAERLCSDPHDGVVEELVPTGERCPGLAEPHRDQQGLGTACVRAG